MLPAGLEGHSLPSCVKCHMLDQDLRGFFRISVVQLADLFHHFPEQCLFSAHLTDLVVPSKFIESPSFNRGERRNEQRTLPMQ